MRGHVELDGGRGWNRRQSQTNEPKEEDFNYRDLDSYLYHAPIYAFQGPNSVCSAP